MVETLKLFAGVDAGASHSVAVLGDAAGRVLQRLQGGPGSLRPGRAWASAGRIARLLQRALRLSGHSAPIQALVVGAAGAGRETERRELEEALKVKVEARAVLVTTDARAALESAFPGSSGIVLSAGTGSIAIGRHAKGTIHRVGGWGWRFGDEGSAYGLARAALAAVARAEDGRGPKTLLTPRLLEAAGVASVEDLMAWARAAQRKQIAAMAPVVCRAAPEDPVAALLVQAAAAELAHHVLALRERLSEPGIPVALSGGLLGTGSPVREALEVRLSASKPPVNLVHRSVDPACGALALALELGC